MTTLTSEYSQKPSRSIWGTLQRHSASSITAFMCLVCTCLAMSDGSELQVMLAMFNFVVATGLYINEAISGRTSNYRRPIR